MLFAETTQSSNDKLQAAPLLKPADITTCSCVALLHCIERVDICMDGWMHLSPANKTQQHLHANTPQLGSAQLLQRYTQQMQLLCMCVCSSRSQSINKSMQHARLHAACGTELASQMDAAHINTPLPSTGDRLAT
jgi:predicted alpha/beta hydrolase family esterase